MIGRIFPFLGTGTLVALAGISGNEAISIITAPPSVSTENAEERESTTNVGANASSPSRQPVEGAVKIIVERPLFAPTRRPEKPPKTEPPNAQSTASEPAIQPVRIERPQLVLHGVMQTGEGLAALLSLPGELAEWMPQGSDVQGWALKEIGSDWVVLTNDTLRHKVEMY